MTAMVQDFDAVRKLSVWEIDEVAGGVPRWADWNGDGDIFDEVTYVAGAVGIVAAVAGAAPVVATAAMIGITAAYLDQA